MSQNNGLGPYASFDDWFHEQEGFGLRSERFDGDVEWLKAAFAAGRASPIQADGLEVAMQRAIERLRNLNDYAGSPTWERVLQEELGAMFSQAQSALAAMKGDQARISMGWADTLNELETAEARIKALKEALRPFAALGEEAEWMTKPDDAGAWGFDDVHLTWGDFRRARTALSESNKP